MNSTSYLTPTVQIASPCYLIKKKKRRKKEHEIYTYIYLKPRRERWNNKNIFSIEWKKEKKKRNILFENVRQHDTIGTLRFFFHGSRLRFSLFIARSCFQPLHIYACLVVANEICARKGVCVRERETWLDEKRKKNWNRKFGWGRRRVSLERGCSSPLRKNIPNIPELWPIIISKVLEQRRDRGGVVGGLEGEGKHVSLVNDNDEHRCKPDDNA